MRVSTAFNTMLAIPGAAVTGVRFEPTCIVAELRLRKRRPFCPCGLKGPIHDRSMRRWRHLDLGGTRLFLEATIRRVNCSACGRVRTEAVPWARAGARHTRDLQDLIAYMAQRMDKTAVKNLLRVSWKAVANTVIDVVGEQLDDSRLNNLHRIGVDEVSYRKGHRYLTVVADHDRGGAVVWVKEGKDAATLGAFYEALGPERCAQIQAVSLDFGRAIKKATDSHVPQAKQCADPFHVIQHANHAVDLARSWAVRNQRLKEPTIKRKRGRQPEPVIPPRSRWIKHTRWALIKNPENLSEKQRAVLADLRRQHSILYRAWELKEALRDIFRVSDHSLAPPMLDRWLARASRCRIPSFVHLSRMFRDNRDRILAAIELRLSNSKLEGLNSKIRLINHRGYGHRSVAALIAMIYLCCGGISVSLPFR